jgi:hypothetical protein
MVNNKGQVICSEMNSNNATVCHVSLTDCRRLSNRSNLQVEYHLLKVRINENVVQGIKSRNLITNRVKGNCRLQDRQCTYDVTLRRVLATIVAVEEQ